MRRISASIHASTCEFNASGVSPSLAIGLPIDTVTTPGNFVNELRGHTRPALCAIGTTGVPIAHNAGRVWPRNSFTKFPGVVTVSIGKPIASEGLTPDALNSQVEAWIEAEMRRIDPDAYRQAGNAGTRDAARA